MKKTIPTADGLALRNLFEFVCHLMCSLIMEIHLRFQSVLETTGVNLLSELQHHFTTAAICTLCICGLHCLEEQ